MLTWGNFAADQVIRALFDYDAATPQELSFSRGDFFHVIGRENDQDWYEACNPALPDARGLVPVSYFQALGRTERDSGSQPEVSAPRTAPAKSPDHDSGYGDAAATMTSNNNNTAASNRASKTSSRAGAMVYGVVMYDFQAERPDELEAKAGEAIIVIAQSNPEWFVAKPIGRLGGPGLIPVTFVEIRDMASNTPVVNPQDAVRRAGIPKVEEWKKMAADYKNSSITLGKFEVGGTPKQSLEQGMERMSIQQQQQQQTNTRVNSVSAAPSQVCASSMLDMESKLTSLHRPHSSPDIHPSRPETRCNQTRMRPGPPRSCLRPSMPGYLDTALPRTSTGSSSRRNSRTVGRGNCLAITRTFMTSRSPS